MNKLTLITENLFRIGEVRNMDYRVQRLKEDLTNAQQRNKKQRIQLANYKKCHERDLGTIKKQKEVIDKITNAIQGDIEGFRTINGHGESTEILELLEIYIDILKEVSK